MRAVPFPLMADAYTISGEAFAGREAIQKSIYNVTNRIGPSKAIGDISVAKDNRMVFYGLSEFIRRHLSTPITHDDIDAAKAFMETAHSFGGPLNFPEKTWRRVVDEYEGYLPIKISALREGSTFFPYEPVIQVESSGEGFGELAAHIEAVMLGMVSVMSARATICRHWLDRIREEFGRNKYSNPNFTMSLASNEDLAEFDVMARFFIHDFGMRASSCAEESELLGMAHLLVFHGTDTFNAAYAAMERGAERPTGTSILALAHRIVQGHTTEEEAFEAIFGAAGEGGIASYVADCYNFKTAVQKHLKAMAERNKGCIVVRPDSGDYLENCLFVAQEAYEAGLQDGQDRPGATSMRFIQGDSMNPDKVNHVLQCLRNKGFNSVNWGIFGVGGWLRNTPTRDLFSSAYKLATKGLDNEAVCKLSDTPAKMSVPGDTIILRGNGACVTGPSVYFRDEFGHGADEREVYYKDGAMFDIMAESFADISKRTIEDFDTHLSSHPNFGHDKEVDVLSPKIRDFQSKVVSKYKV